MKPQANIMVAQIWNLGLAQEIGQGIVDYASHQTRFRVSFQNLKTILEDLERWGKPEGIILSEDPGCAPFDKIRRLNIPFVSLGWHPEEADILQVDFDPAAAGRMAAEHLIVESGYHHLACIHREPKNSRARMKGFSDLCEANGITPTVFELVGFTPDGVPPAFTEWVQTTPSPATVFCCDDELAVMASQIIHSEGLHIPEDIAVLGCGDDTLRCKQTTPAISSVHLPYQKIGGEAIRMLDYVMQGRMPKKKHVFLPPEGIITRMSTSLFATDDLALRKALEFIRRHAAEKITVADVARHAGLSVRTLQNRFRKAIGHSPTEEQRRTRMAKTCELLRGSSLTLDEISEIVGYESGHSLSSAFKAFHGESARIYRNRFLLSEPPD